MTSAASCCSSVHVGSKRRPRATAGVLARYPPAETTVPSARRSADGAEVGGSDPLPAPDVVVEAMEAVVGAVVVAGTADGSMVGVEPVATGEMPGSSRAPQATATRVTTSAKKIHAAAPLPFEPVSPPINPRSAFVKRPPLFNEARQNLVVDPAGRQSEDNEVSIDVQRQTA